MNKTVSKVFIAADHRGVGLKLYLIEMLAAAGYNVVNLGVDDPNTSVDYPDVAAALADAMLDMPDSRGIIICGTGAGVMIAANRYRHIRASRCDTPAQARDDRFHDDTNVLALAADKMTAYTSCFAVLFFVAKHTFHFLIGIEVFKRCFAN